MSGLHSPVLQVYIGSHTEGHSSFPFPFSVTGRKENNRWLTGKENTLLVQPQHLAVPLDVSRPIFFKKSQPEQLDASRRVDTSEEGWQQKNSEHCSVLSFFFQVPRLFLLITFEKSRLVSLQFLKRQ